MRTTSVNLTLLLLVVAGCGELEDSKRMVTSEVATPSPAGSVEFYAGAKSEPGRLGQATGRAPAGADAAAEPPPAFARKIIYDADVSLSVESFAKAEEEVSRLVRVNQGYVAESNVSGNPGQHRSGRWKVRIPVEKYDGFVESIVRLGELEQRHASSQDVSAEFYDLDARIKNKKVEEGRLVKHLEESTGKLEEILLVEKEISRVREEVERMQGRLQFLANMTSLTTVTINLNERVGFIPTTAPTFPMRVARRFAYSRDMLLEWLETVTLLMVSILPWLPFWIVLGLLVWVSYRKLARPLWVRMNQPIFARTPSPGDRPGP